jgi:hypothetical protein
MLAPAGDVAAADAAVGLGTELFALALGTLLVIKAR